MLEKDNAILAVIDLQDSLLAKMPAADTIVDESLKLIRSVRELGLPVVWTEQYPRGLGRTRDSVVEALEGCGQPLEKVSFGCFGAPGFREALAKTGRNQLLIVGIEAHVCVLQTALAGLEEGYGVFVASDASGSRRRGDYEAALARMRRNGVEIVTAEMAIFELLGRAGTPEVKRVLPWLK